MIFHLIKNAKCSLKTDNNTLKVIIHNENTPINQINISV